MYKVVFPKSQLISPTNPILRIEEAIDCDGSECGISLFDGIEHLVDSPPHFHLVESETGAWTRNWAIGGPLPEVSYESPRE
jgi:hypothetical protein